MWTKTKPKLDHPCELVVSKDVILETGRSRISKLYTVFQDSFKDHDEDGNSGTWTQYMLYDGSKGLDYEDIRGDWYLIIEPTGELN